jgi:hypothetical protein
MPTRQKQAKTSGRPRRRKSASPGLLRIKHAGARAATTYLLAMGADHAANRRPAAARESLDSAYRIVVGLPRRLLADPAKIAITDAIEARAVALGLRLKGSHEDLDGCECSGKLAKCVAKDDSSCRQFYDDGKPAGCGAL